MINATNIFVSTPPAAKSHVPSKSEVHTTESASSGETSKNDNSINDNELKNEQDVDHSEEPKGGSHKKSRRTRTNDSAKPQDETKSNDKSVKKGDEKDFQQLIAVAMTDTAGETPPATLTDGEASPETPVAAGATAAGAIPAVIPEAASGESVSPGVLVTNPAVPAPVESAAIPTQVAASTTPTLEAAQDLPKPVIASPKVGAPLSVTPLPAEKNEQPLPIEHTSGRPESTPIKANVPQADIPRINVEAPASSTDAKTAATETNPRSGDSDTMTPGRPVVPLSTSDSPKADAPVSPVQAPVKFAAAGEKQTDAQSSSGESESSDQPPARQPAADGNAPQAFVPPASAQALQAASRYAPAEPQTAQASVEQNASENVAAVADSTTAGRRTSGAEAMLGQWENVAPTNTASTPAGTVAEVSATRGANVADQIATHVQMRRDALGEEMVIRLDPPELGKVHIQFRSQNGELTGMIRADNPQTLAELQRESTSLLQRLNDAGVQIKTLDVQMNDMNQQGRGEQSFAQAQNAYSMFQQHNGDGRGGYGYNHAGPNEPNETIQDDSQTWSSRNEQYITDSAVNVML